MKITWIALCCALLVALAACGPLQQGEEELAPSDPLAAPLSDSSTGDTIAMTPPPAKNDGLQYLIDQAKEDLSKKLDILIEEIRLMDAKAVVWPDASLGCPQPGMQYKQVPEDGAVVMLQAGGITYEYHTGGSRGLFLCERKLKDPTAPTPIDLFSLTPSNPGGTTPDNGIPPGEGQ